MSYYKIENLEQYFKHYNKSVREPRKFWGKIAEENFTWYQQWDKVVEFNMADADIKWFTEAKVNIVKNCIDRHLAKRGEKTAIIFNYAKSRMNSNVEFTLPVVNPCFKILS